jgi:putative zinc finger protein/TonB-like protein
MICFVARRRLSAFVDGDLPAAQSQELSSHLRGCARCAARLRSLQATLEGLADMPRLEPRDAIASRIFDRLEAESRGPGLALVFRGKLAPRPLILPSLVTSSLILAVVLASALALDRPRDERSVSASDDAWPAVRPSAWGTEGNPALPFAGVAVPRARSGSSYGALLGDTGEGTLFLETVVARDGSVSMVTLINGDQEQARPVLDAVRQQRFEPVQYQGRPVAVSIYRLFSRLDVRSPTT